MGLIFKMNYSLYKLRDFLMASLILLLLSPILFITALLVRINLGSPILFRQTRSGQEGSPFKLYKFRTMTDDKDAQGNILSDNQRLTQFGKFLRSTSLDELPSLYNVLKGDMSIVGPRPMLMSYLPLYSEDQMRRHEVLPGITGWAQVNGRNAISWEEKFKLDVWYVENRSHILDLKILIKTVKKVIKREDISEKNGPTMSRFNGSN